MKKIAIFAILTTCALMTAGCSPEVGSQEWCKQMDQKPKGDWTAKEAAAYAKHCILK